MNKHHLFSVAVTAQQRPIVSIENYPVYDNDVTFLFGESGIGKSIITKALYGLLHGTGLQVQINNKPYENHLKNPWTAAVRKNGFFVFQEPSSHLNPLMTIRDQLNEGNLANCSEQEILATLWEDQSAASIDKILSLFPKTFRPSGGEKQRVLLAMAFKRINTWVSADLGTEPTYFVFDEPTGSLDNNYRDLFLDLLLEKYDKRPFSTLIITHDYSIISKIYRTHKRLMDRIHFKELTRGNNTQVSISDFSAHDYLDWLDRTDKKPASSLVAEPVLELAPQLTIFGRKLCIYQDAQYTRSVPLIINKGTMVYLKAPSGIGKTTIAKIIMGIYHPESFSMTLDRLTLTERSRKQIWPRKIWGKRAGMVFQHADESLNLAATVLETFAGLPLKKKLSPKELATYLAELFDAPVSPSFLNKKVLFLSGGQKQRLNLLRTLVLDTDLIILDEPLNGLDFVSVQKVLTLLDKKCLAGKALLMISHNEEIFEHIIAQDKIFYLGVG